MPPNLTGAGGSRAAGPTSEGSTLPRAHLSFVNTHESAVVVLLPGGQPGDAAIGIVQISFDNGARVPLATLHGRHGQWPRRLRARKMHVSRNP
jgi:hypothetical protein